MWLEVEINRMLVICGNRYIGIVLISGPSFNIFFVESLITQRNPEISERSRFSWKLVPKPSKFQKRQVTVTCRGVRGSIPRRGPTMNIFWKEINHYLKTQNSNQKL